MVATRFASKRSSFLVAAGIFLSRIAGLIRDRVFAHYFGNSDAADAFKAAFRIPNALQNLFGEGVLSASFIPVYAALLARDEDEEARRTAGAVAALLALSTSILVLVGVLETPYLIDAIAPGFGRGSCARHIARALARGCTIEVLRLPGLASDIDGPRDLAHLTHDGPRAERYRFVALAREAHGRQTAPAACQ